jgi:hypothetical protein
MSRTYKDSPNAKHTRPPGRRRDISVRAVRREPPDTRKLSRALIALAMAEADASQAQDPAAPPPVTDRPAEADTEAHE